MRQPFLRWRAAKLVARAGLDPGWRVRRGPGRGLRLAVARSSGDYWSGRNELPVQRAVFANLRPGDTFYDVGANIGFFSLLAARCVGPTGRVVAFEPVPENVRCFEANAARNGVANVEVHRVAVGARSGTGVLALAHHPGGSALDEAGRPADYAGPLDVQLRSLDDLVLGGETAPPTMVKIDVEGAESAVLDGMARTASRLHPTVVVETDGPTAEEVSRRTAALTEQLVGLGYEVERLPDSYGNRRWHVAHLLARA